MALKNFMTQAQKKAMPAYSAEAALSGNRYAQEVIKDLKRSTEKLEDLVKEAKCLIHFRQKERNEGQPTMAIKEVKDWLNEAAISVTEFDGLYNMVPGFDAKVSSAMVAHSEPPQNIEGILDRVSPPP